MLLSCSFTCYLSWWVCNWSSGKMICCTCAVLGLVYLFPVFFFIRGMTEWLSGESSVIRLSLEKLHLSERRNWPSLMFCFSNRSIPKSKSCQSFLSLTVCAWWHVFFSLRLELFTCSYLCTNLCVMTVNATVQLNTCNVPELCAI